MVQNQQRQVFEPQLRQRRQVSQVRVSTRVHQPTKLLTGHIDGDVQGRQAPPMRPAQLGTLRVGHLHLDEFRGRAAGRQFEDRRLMPFARLQESHRDPRVAASEMKRSCAPGDVTSVRSHRPSTEVVAAGDEQRRMKGSEYQKPR